MGSASSDTVRTNSPAMGVALRCRRHLLSILGLACVASALLYPAPGIAQPVEPVTLFQNVMIFDGKADALSGPSNVLVAGNKIARISSAAIVAPTGALTIDGGRRVLIPGLIDAHWHAMLVRPTPMAALSNDVGYSALLAAAEASATLMRGFTTVRDLGGPAFGLKRAIDERLVPGPRIFPSGAMITITGGHGDFRQLHELPRVVGGPPARMEQIGGSALADSPDEVRLRAREQLMQGASQIKLTAGGGVSSPFSPLDVATFTEAELRAAVDAADSWGTYVTVHAYTPVAIQRAITAGVRCIEHGHLMDDATARMMADKGIWLSTQPFFDDEDTTPFPPNSDERAKQLEVIQGTDSVLSLARKYRIKTAIGTDILFSPNLAARQGAQLAKLKRWYSSGEILRMATSGNAELLQLSGLRSPYAGRLGVIEEGALADLILVDGDPLRDISLIGIPTTSFIVIMKDGIIFKNSKLP